MDSNNDFNTEGIAGPTASGTNAWRGNSNDFDTRVIEEFRANDGKIGGPFANTPVFLLTTIGARSG